MESIEPHKLRTERTTQDTAGLCWMRLERPCSLWDFICTLKPIGWDGDLFTAKRQSKSDFTMEVSFGCCIKTRLENGQDVLGEQFR